VTATPSITPTPIDRRSRQASRLGQWLSVGGVYVFVAALLMVGRCVSSQFFAPDKFMSMVQDVSILGVIAVGVAFITYSGHYVDLAIPAIMSCSGIVAISLLPHGLPAALAAGLATGVLVGAINGAVVGYLRLNPIIWTLAVLSVLDGGIRWWFGGRQIYADADKTTSAGADFVKLYGHQLGGVPLIVVILLVAAAAGMFVMRWTGFGRRLKLTGANYDTARLTGVNVRRTVMMAFMISGFTSAMGGILLTSLNKVGNAEVGLTYDFQAITAVVLGGVTLAGGRGGMLGVLGGVLVIGLLGKIMPLMGVSQDMQKVVQGLIFIAVVGLNMYSLRRSGRDDA